MFHLLVKTFASCVLIGFLLTCDLAPGNADILSFKSLLANFTEQKHLASSPNMTSDRQRPAAAWPAGTESRIPYWVLGIKPRNIPEY